MGRPNRVKAPWRRSLTAFGQRCFLVGLVGLAALGMAWYIDNAIDVIMWEIAND